MKALVKSEAKPGIWMKDIEVPKVGPNDVLIKIGKTAICGTDMHIYNWDAWAQKTIPVPMAVGHEYFGRIVDMGSEVRGFSVGDRVSGEGHATCAATPWVWASIDRAASPSTCRSPPAMPSNYPTRLPTTSPASSIPSATRRTPRSPSTWWARMC